MGAIDTRYIDLERKIEQVRYLTVTSNSMQANQYIQHRRAIIDRYFAEGTSDEVRKALLGMFDEANKQIAEMLGT